jgi:hypothetical protein
VVWTHRAAANGTSEPVPSVVEVRTEGAARRFALTLSNGQALAPIDGEVCVLRIALRGGEDG